MNDHASRHWSFWIVTAVAFIWYAMGSVNFVMQMNPESLARYPEPARLLIESRPGWATAAFAVADFGGVVGTLLLMLRRSAAPYLFTVVLLGVGVTNIHTVAIGGGSAGIWVGSTLSLALAALLIWYSNRVALR